MDGKPYYHIESAQRAIRILKAFQPEHRVWGVTDLSRHLGLSKSVVHRLLLTLEQEGVVQRDVESGAYRLGMEAYHIGMVYLGQWNLPGDSARYLRMLVHDLEMMAHLAVLDAGQVMYVNVVYPPRYAGGEEFSWAGRRQPPIRSGLGKVLLAWMPRARLNQLLEPLAFEPITHRTIADRETFKKHLAQVRKQGYALDDQEISIGWRCVAAPVFDHTRQVTAAISVSATTQQMPLDQIGHVARTVTQSALRLSEQLGYR